MNRIFYKCLGFNTQIKFNKPIFFYHIPKCAGISITKSNFYAFCLFKPERNRQIWVLIPTTILKKLMKKYPIKNGGDNWEAKGHIIPKEDLLNYEL